VDETSTGNFDIRKAITLRFISITIALELHTSETKGFVRTNSVLPAGRWPVPYNLRGHFFSLPPASSVKHDDQLPMPGMIIVRRWTKDVEDLSCGAELHLHLLLRRWKQALSIMRGGFWV
jgi:hypothetical protein